LMGKDRLRLSIPRQQWHGKIRGGPEHGSDRAGAQSILSNQDGKTLSGGNARHARLHFLG
jgi:hypothetical protein